MANAQFCILCGEMTSDGCAVLDEQGNETNEMNFTPCDCVMADYLPVSNDQEPSIHAEIERLSVHYPIDYITNNDIFEKKRGQFMASVEQQSYHRHQRKHFR